MLALAKPMVKTGISAAISTVVLAIVIKSPVVRLNHSKQAVALLSAHLFFGGCVSFFSSLQRYRCATALAFLLPCAAWAKPQLQCTFEVNSEIHHRVFALAADPYAVEGVPIGNRFRFKAIVLGEGERVESVNLYVYYNTRRQPMIMQHTQFLQPKIANAAAEDALTGRVSVYSPLLGKELMYRCALQEVTQ
jgi:hypothetical protein